LTNARDAMPDGGTIRITVSRATSEADADRVVLGVHDSGSGMAPEVRERAFEPFFTTKGVGQGSGLGLAGVYGFARQNGGSAWIESAPGEGTDVFVAVPAGKPIPIAETAQADPPATPPEELASEQPGRRVLVVEDDGLVCMVTVDALKEAGYFVIAARNGVEALAVLEREGATLSAVVTDVAMPGGVSGTDVAREVGRTHPDLALILTTGYAADRIPTEEMPPRFAFVAKPFAAEVLVDRLAALLRQPASARSA
jgi:CheY-like chemotaxis protein